MTRVLVIDNFDSFVYILNDYLLQLGAQSTVVRNNFFSASDVSAVLEEYDALLISPGPGQPENSGSSMAFVEAALKKSFPVLGVCLGHQIIAEYFGATVAPIEEMMHGKTSDIFHDESELYRGLKQGFKATRYHSLAVVEKTLPSVLTVSSRTEKGIIMGLRHEAAPLCGVQFHPESILTEGGHQILANWLSSVGKEVKFSSFLSS